MVYVLPSPPSPAVHHVAAPRPLTNQDTTEALFWLDSQQIRLPRRSFPRVGLPLPDQPGFLHGDMTSACEGREEGGGARHLETRSVARGLGVSAPSNPVGNIPSTFNLPFLSLFVCLTPRLGCSFVTVQRRCLSHPPPLVK